jgi:hypothetical protein
MYLVDIWHSDVYKNIKEVFRLKAIENMNTFLSTSAFPDSHTVSGIYSIGEQKCY